MPELQQDPGNRIHIAIRQRLESLRRAGVRQIPKLPVSMVANAPAMAKPQPEPVVPTPRATAREAIPTIAAPAAAPAVATPAPVTAAPPAAASVSAVSAIETPAKPASVESPLVALERVRREVVHCTLCHELATTRTQTVFGTGNPRARLCFFGEAPGADEDRQGEPFVGAAGQLLNKIIEACTLKREDVYILNVLKCRPPQNRTPLPEETANCRAYFERQLEIIRPEFICCLGAVASQALLRTTQSLGRLRGRFHDYRGIRVMVTYHPAYLLRYPDKKRETWEDMKMLMQEMGIELPGR
jgi:uracil-DNA glycosylase